MGVVTAPYCTAQDVVDCCDWPAFGNLSTSAQARKINAASSRVDEVCRRPFGFGSQSVTEVFSPRNQSAVYLTLRPVQQVMTVTLNGTALDNSLGDAWTFHPGTGRLVRGDGQDDPRFAPWWPSGDRNLAVQYWGGYQALPDDLVMATAYMVRWLHERGRVAGIYASESVGGWSGTLAGDDLSQTVPPHVMALLSDYVIEDAFA